MSLHDIMHMFAYVYTCMIRRYVPQNHGSYGEVWRWVSEDVYVCICMYMDICIEVRCVELAATISCRMYDPSIDVIESMIHDIMSYINRMRSCMIWCLWCIESIKSCMNPIIDICTILDRYLWYDMMLARLCHSIDSDPSIYRNLGIGAWDQNLAPGPEISGNLEKCQFWWFYWKMRQIRGGPKNHEIWEFSKIPR